MDYKYTGIIIDKRDIGETDRIYTAFTLEGGKIRALAKGVRKAQAKLAGNLENFTLADLSVVKNQGAGKITASIVENNFTRLKSNPEALPKAFESTRLFGQLVQLEDRDERLFGLLREYLETLDHFSDADSDRIGIISEAFAFKLLEALGYGLEVGRCVACGDALRTGLRLFFDAGVGGVVSEECLRPDRKAITISPNAVKLLRIFYQNRIGALAKLKAAARDIRELMVIRKTFLVWIGK